MNTKNVSAATEKSGFDSPSIAEAIVKAAKKALEKNLVRRKNKGQHVVVERQPYHEGLSRIRCVLLVDGEKTRLYYNPDNDSWIRAS